MRLTNDRFLEKAYSNNNKITILEEYKGAEYKIDVQCRKCKYLWKMTPTNIYKNKGCPICYGNIKKTTEQFILELNLINNKIEVLSEYEGNKIKIKCFCKICNNIWDARPSHLLDGHGCPNCIKSTGECIIKSILENKKIKFEEQKKFDDLKGIKGGHLSFDFYLLEYNTLIEYQGSQHYKPNGYLGGKEKFKYQIKNDKIKKEYIKSHDLKLFEICYKDNVKDKLLSFLETVTTAGY